MKLKQIAALVGLALVLSAQAADLKALRIGTDATWRMADGPVVFSHIYAGEDLPAANDEAKPEDIGFGVALAQLVHAGLNHLGKPARRRGGNRHESN